jgi:hypothetical protein
MKRILFLIAAAAIAAAASAQTVQLQTGTQPALEVQRLAPQLVSFAGGDVNFTNLVNGLALGVPITLTTTLAPGVTQVVTFTPSGTMTPVQVAQVLETARQSLIARGIATPTAQQLATSLVGGSLPTALGNTQVNSLVSTSTAVGTTTQQMSPAAALQANVAPNAAAGGTTGRANMSDSLFPRGISDTPPLPVPGVTTGPGTTAGATGTTNPNTSATGAAALPAPAGRVPVFGAR